jgi:hypothetical protein
MLGTNATLWRCCAALARNDKAICSVFDPAIRSTRLQIDAAAVAVADGDAME